MDVKEKILSLKSHYRSGKANLGRDFFLPCLTLCILYKRAVGYFSSSVLITWAEALPRFAQGDNVSIKLLVSPLLTKQDKEALEQIDDPEKRDILLQKLSDRIVLDAIDFAKGNQTDEKRMRLFSWMVASGKLELRFAYPCHIDKPGIFHEKIGIFEFPWEDKVAFTGSANESAMGHSKNYESVDVFRSWISSDSERVKIKEEEFEEAWTGIAEGLKVKQLSKSALGKIKSYSPERPIYTKEESNKDANINISKKWKHQDEAIATFLQKERGVLEMATGTGKTRAALRICGELVNKNLIETIIISMDGNDLLDQWYLNVLKEVKNLKNKFTILRHYNIHRERELFMIDQEWKILIVSRPELPSALNFIDSLIGQKTLLIHDEVHRLGSPANMRDLSGLTDEIRFRLGLSATPEREYDEEGTAFITHHIGPIIFNFDLKDAIKRGILCPFNYYPIEYEITDGDKAKLKKLKAHYEASKNTPNPMPKETLWIAMANVFKTSEAKIPLFNLFISKHQDLLKRCIIFVGTHEYGEKILNIVHKYNPDFHTYFSGEDSETLKRFARGDLECLITCHRLSEGIDIQSLNNVILLSTDRAKLELIQRIGRCLRTDPTNPNKRANIIDFIRIKNKEGKDVKGDDLITADEIRREWLVELSKIQPEE
jgi:superfamily II DNA or RNA helicase